MKRQILILLLGGICIATNSQAQWLNKLKNKVVNAVEKKETTAVENAVPLPDNYCTDSIYTEVFKGVDEHYTIDYTESSIGIGADAKGYRIVIKILGKGKNVPYMVITNTGVKQYASVEEMIADTEKIPLPKNKLAEFPFYSFRLIDSQVIKGQDAREAKSITLEKIETKNVNTGFEIAKQTDEYKKLTPAEKKDFDEMMKTGGVALEAYNKNMAGKTLNIAAVAATKDIVIPPGFAPDFDLIVKGKNYGHFSDVSEIIALKVSKDEKQVYYITKDKQQNFIMHDRDKKINLTAIGFKNDMVPEIVTSKSGTSYFVYADVNRDEAYQSLDAKLKTFYWKNDGTSFTLIRPTKDETTDCVTESGNHVMVDFDTKEYLIDGKLSGQIPTGKNGKYTVDFNKSNLVIGSTPLKIAFYDTDGSLFFLDGSKKKNGIINPQTVFMEGVLYLTWFRKCFNNIYIAKLPF